MKVKHFDWVFSVVLSAISTDGQGCGVGGKIYDYNSDLSEFSDSDSLT